MDEKLLPTDKQERKKTPMFTGLLAYFPDALAELARISYAGNAQHTPGEPLHWAREKSSDHLDCVIRHLVDNLDEPIDTDGRRHLGKAAWRLLAQLQLDIENERERST